MWCLICLIRTGIKSFDIEKGVPQNEKDVIESREAYDSQKAKSKAERKGRIEKIQALADKIKAEEIEKKAAAKK